MINKTVLISSIFVLFACASTDSPTTPTDNDFVERAKAHVSQRLINPESAKFQNIMQKKPDVICGEISATNAEGEYTVFTPFYYQEKNGKIFARVADENPLSRTLFNSLYRAHCK